MSIKDVAMRRILQLNACLIAEVLISGRINTVWKNNMAGMDKQFILNL